MSGRMFSDYVDQPDTAERARQEAQSIPFAMPEKALRAGLDTGCSKSRRVRTWWVLGLLPMAGRLLRRRPAARAADLKGCLIYIACVSIHAAATPHDSPTTGGAPWR